jgi:retron-type reverse transcriptase
LKESSIEKRVLLNSFPGTLLLLERVLLNKIERDFPNIQHQHRYKRMHSTTSALHKINDVICAGFNEKAPPNRTIMVALDMSSAFDTINYESMIEKLLLTPIPKQIVKFLVNYLRGRKGYVDYYGSKSRQRTYHGGVPQGGVLSPVLFNAYMADLPTP